MLFLISAAWAATVAVLPLDQGAGGQAYEGLGAALAGMLTSDLSTAPDLTLVERSRLDALTTEIELGKGGFVDPATAQKLGKGLGAEYVVLGSYSVVGDTFLLDARLVSVAGGTVAKAASAQGTVGGFVDVEKELVGELLSGLSVKLGEADQKKLAGRAPTKNFDAFAAYGAGLAAEKAGHVDAARKAYAEALAADPLYAEASTALGGLRMKLDASQAERLKKEKGARAALLDKVVATFPEPTNGKDKKQQAGFLLRLLALDEQGRHCQRYAEMQRYLDTTSWSFDLDDKGYKRLWTDATALAVEVGYAPNPDVDPQGHRGVEFKIQSDGATILSSPARFFYNFPTMLLTVATSDDLTATMTRCLTPPEQLVELTRLSAQVRAHGLGDVKPFDYPVGLAERLEWSAMAVKARTTGVDAAMAARMEQLIAAYDDTIALKATGGSTARAWVETEARQITAAGLLIEKARVAKLGWRDADLLAALDAMAALDPKRLAVDDADCSQVLKNQQYWAAATKKGKLYPGVQALVTPLRDIGCFVGTPARFGKLEDAMKFVAEAPARALPESKDTPACQKAFEELPQQIDPPYPVPLDGSRAQQLLGWYYSSLVMNLCVPE